jgi:hypothetical protein
MALPNLGLVREELWDIAKHLLARRAGKDCLRTNELAARQHKSPAQPLVRRLVLITYRTIPSHVKSCSARTIFSFTSRTTSKLMLVVD